MSVRAVVLALVLVVASLSGSVLAADNESVAEPDGPHIETVYPNPLADGDAGEYVVVDVPDRTNLSGLSIGDNETTIALPNETVGGRVAVTNDPNATNLSASTVISNDSLSLANGGEELVLADGGSVVDETAYEDAPDAEIWNRTADGWTWEHRGATDFEAVQFDATTARAFVLPDAPGVPIDVLDSADERILLAGYSFSSERAARALERAAERGVEVRMVVDDAPVGGISERQAELLDELTRAGIPVDVIGGDWARYDYHHPKYAVVDDRALVMTENWKPSGIGGKSSRGWGAVVEGDVTDRLAAVFHADADWRDTAPWSTFRANRTFEDDEVANESYPTTFEPTNVSIESAQLLAAPDNAENALVERLDDADESIDVVQASIGSRQQPFLRAAIRAAERGVRVRILLGGAWYSEEDNSALAEWLNGRAAARNLSLEAKVAESGSRFEKIHAKGVIIDGEEVVVGSMNWNNNSARENREIALVLDGEAAGDYYGKVFEADWTGGEQRSLDTGTETPLPVGVIAAVVGVAVLAAVVARRIEFE
ncbi:phospholipase D-like domain-containing protein [Halococcus dombrowskii]|uniref:Phospholipase D-like domain-containing protein n=1 Tax=Halococcus dombrowskii TaxID=179637 RepID=A0AAV3SCT6_HALDO|nr:phospholipase D-like domain-containing protein [Halococcus dombrowskii]UOO94136.1 phospholipase D-like domain-containing protein [Halococcus dombrowskii]